MSELRTSFLANKLLIDVSPVVARFDLHLDFASRLFTIERLLQQSEHKEQFSAKTRSLLAEFALSDEIIDISASMTNAVTSPVQQAMRQELKYDN